MQYYHKPLQASVVVDGEAVAIPLSIVDKDTEDDSGVLALLWQHIVFKSILNFLQTKQ